MKIIQKGFNYSQDGPGNRLVYHLQGCNMRCPWCANPEGLSVEGTKMLVKDGTTGRIREVMSYKEQSVEEMLDEILRSKMMFFEDGGVTFTGGEPTLQFEQLLALMKLLKEQNIHIAMENNGTHVRLPELLPYIDYLIMDFKHPDDVKHKEVTGISNAGILKNLREVLQSGRQIALRIPLIHGFNDTPQALEGFLAFFKEQKAAGGDDELDPLNLSKVTSGVGQEEMNRKNPLENVTLEILPYHEFGKEKWQQCGMEYTVTDGFVSDNRVKEMEEAFRAIGVKVIHT